MSELTLPQKLLDVVSEHIDDPQEVILAKLAEALAPPPAPEFWNRAWDL